MRKMTKTAAVLAAMSAMTVASASLALAATPERVNLTSLPKEVAAAGSAVGVWDQTKDGWTFTPDGEKILKDTWANIDGADYYFHEDGIMASNELVVIDDETYFFYKDGRMHAGGWLAFDADDDIILDYGRIDVNEYWMDIVNPVDDGGYDTLWMYFKSNGKAADDEWVKDCDMYYYMDDVVMVCGDYDHFVGDDIYGFAADGHMYVGWEKAYDNKSLLAPAKDASVWYYYGTDGEKYLGRVDGDGNLGYNWRKIDGEWYCFADETNSGYTQTDLNIVGASYGTLVTKAYFKNTNVGTTDDWYYVNDKGVMQYGGVKDLPKNYAYVTGAWATKGTTKATKIYVDKDGKVKTGWQGDNYFVKVTNFTAPVFADVMTFNTAKLAEGATTYKSDVKNIYGHLATNAFVTDDTKTWLVDKNGKKVTNTVTLVGYVSANDTATATIDAIKDGTNASGAATLEKWDKKSDNVGQYNAYILHDKNGLIDSDADGYDAGRKVTVGGRQYVATDLTVNVNGNDLQIFIYPNENGR